MIQLFFSTFWMVFVAELGDKTQLTTMTNAADAGAKGLWTVFAGSASALVLSAALAVLVGAKINQYVSPKTIKIVAGFVFVFFGLLSFYRAFSPEK